MNQKRLSPFAKRLCDSLALYKQGRYEGALLMVVVAVAAASRRRFPAKARSIEDPIKKMSDREAFVSWLDQEFDRRKLPHRMVWNGVERSTNFILYKWMRNALAHEAELPEEIYFERPRTPRHVYFRQCDRKRDHLHVSCTVIVLLAEIVATSAEGRGVPKRIIKEFVATLGELVPAPNSPPPDLRPGKVVLISRGKNPAKAT